MRPALPAPGEPEEIFEQVPGAEYYDWNQHPQRIRFATDLVLMAGIVLVGMRPLLPFVRRTLAERGA